MPSLFAHANCAQIIKKNGNLPMSCCIIQTLAYLRLETKSMAFTSTPDICMNIVSGI